MLTKRGSPEMVGQFALGLAIVKPVVMFTGLELRKLQATDARGKYQFEDYLGLRLIGTALALLVIVGIIVGLGYRRETALIILAVGVAKAFESVSDVFYGLFQRYERMDYIARSMMCKGPLSLVALGTGMYLTGHVFWGVVGMAIAWALVLVIHDVLTGMFILQTALPPGSTMTGKWGQKWTLRPRYEMRTLLRLVWLALPLGFTIMLLALSSSIPRYFVERYLGEHELGIFAAIAYIPVVGGMIGSALARSATPRLAKYYTAGNGSAFYMLLLKLLGIGVLLGGAGVLVAFVAGREILTLFYSPEYAEHKDVFLRLMVAMGVTYLVWFLNCGMTAAWYLRVQVPLFGLQVVVAALACLWLIPADGLRGASTAGIIAAVVQLFASLAVVAYLLRALLVNHAEER